jgi:hypothetical protein
MTMKANRKDLDLLVTCFAVTMTSAFTAITGSLAYAKWQAGDKVYGFLFVVFLLALITAMRQMYSHWQHHQYLLRRVDEIKTRDQRCPHGVSPLNHCNKCD